MPQIDEKRLQELADKTIYARTNQLNDYVLDTIGGRIKATGRASAYDQQALKNMADITGDMAKIKKKLAVTMEMNVKDVEEILTQTVTEGVSSYKPLYDFKGVEFIPFEKNEYAQFLVNHWAKETTEQMINLSRTKALCFDKYNLAGEVIGSTPLEGAFQSAIDDAVIALSSSTTDFNSAMRKTVESLGGSGVKVAYGSGVTRSLPSMVRQNLLYGAKQSAQAYDRYVGEQLGCDGFEVDYHPHPRLSHEDMGGEMYAYKGTVTIGGKTYENGSEALTKLDEYGCLHFKTDVILGVSEPRYDDEWLEKQKAQDKELIEYNGVKKTKYEWQQGARRLEAETRKQRDIAYMAKSASNKPLERVAKDKVSAYRKSYDDLCDTVGLEKRYNRMATFPSQSAKRAAYNSEIPKKVFPKATTIEDAEKYASENLFSGYLGAKTSYKGISVDIANKVNETLEDLTTKYGRQLAGIEVVNPKTTKGLKLLGGSADAPFATQSLTGKVYVNKDILKNTESLLAYNEKGAKAFKSVIENKARLSANSKALAETYEKAGKSLVDNSLEGMITHEYGHYLNVALNPSKEVVEQIRAGMPKHLISGYSQHNTSEYLAECFVEFEKGDVSKLDDVVVNLFKGVIK